MNRKKFIRQGFLGASLLSFSDHLFSNNNDELKELHPNIITNDIGFNHIPNTQSKMNENTVFHPSESRGVANHGWLQSKHTFSFANYYNPERMHFGVLRVLNDDIVSPGMGFSTHPHDNMEIISIPLEGDLEHKDSMGNIAVIKNGDIQVMSAGTGVQHSEYNKNKNQEVKFLQIWVFPNKKNVTPRYDQMTLNINDRKNKLQQIVSPYPHEEGVWIHQNAWFHLADFDSGISSSYSLKLKGNGVYIFNLNGNLKINDQILKSRDGYGVWSTNEIKIEAISSASFLIMEVPMI
jgi:redox-sensitive bicupin YhaK (pirin superfamily)